jgi:hypothetical protein
VNLRGLEFADVKATRDTQEGMPVLLIDGAIKNVTKQAVEVPRLRFAMRNGAGAEIYAWTAMPERAVLPPGEAQTFTTRLASPPVEGRDLFVRFFMRRDAASTIR